MSEAVKKKLFYRCLFCHMGFESQTGVYHDATFFERGYHEDTCPKCGCTAKSIE